MCGALAAMGRTTTPDSHPLPVHMTQQNNLPEITPDLFEVLYDFT